MTALLQVRGLKTWFDTPQGPARAVDGIDLRVERGETVALVGESGSGKSVTAASVLRLVAAPGRIVAGEVLLDGVDLLKLDRRALRAVRGGRVGMVFQDLSALNPVERIGVQIAEALQLHRPTLTRRSAALQAVELLERVRMPSPAERARELPHRLSGGMRQRALIAQALACGPDLLIADEPTTALDVTTQAQILALLAELQRERGLGLLLITHDLGVVAQVAQRVAVMRAGKLVEEGAVAEVFARPRHPYTAALLGAVALDRLAPGTRLPELGDSVPAGTVFAAKPIEAAAQPLLVLERIVKRYPLAGGGTVQALDDVSLQVARGETLGLVGESGCGKSTLARIAMRLLPASEGRVVFDGEDIGTLPRGRLAPMRARLQMVFQDPYASLNPRLRIGRALEEPLIVQRRAIPLAPAERRERVAGLLQRVGLPASAAMRHPHEFSGGQRQRIAIARALVLQPQLLVCDEAVSALDVSVRAQVLNLLLELRAELGLAMLFISHDLAVVRHMADRVAVMYLGRVVESAPRDALWRRPRHPYTQALMAASVRPESVVSGEVPSALAPPSGCHFHPRCPHATARCRSEAPLLRTIDDSHAVACHLD